MRLSILSLLLLFCLNIHAQDYKFKDVTKAELEEKFHPKDSTAPAAVLYEKGYLTMMYDDGWKYKLEVKKRVKIYNSEGYDYATVELPYYYSDNTSSRENIMKVKAYVYNLEGNKIKDDKIRKRDIIDEEVTELRNKVKFTFPNIKPGSVIEYTYIHTSPHIDDFPEWSFQDEIPVNHSVYELVIPEYFGYNERSKGFHTIKRNTENTLIDFRFRQDANYRSKTGTSRIKAVKYTYECHNIPKLKDEPFVNNHSNFLTSIGHELSFFRNPSNNDIKEFTTNWQKASIMLQKSDSFGKELDNTRYFEDDINAILSQSNTADEKIYNIFNFVKNQMTWNNYVGIYCSDKLKRAYKERTGSIADINLMLTSMLRYAGFEAYPVLVSTIDNGIPSPTVSTEDYNYIISAIEFKNNQILLLDASNPFTAPNLLPTRCLNWHGRLIRPDGTSKRISLNPKSLSKDNFIMTLKINETGKLEGQMRRQYTNQYAYQYRVKYSAVDQEDYVDKLQNLLKVTINDYNIQNISSLSKPVVETLSFESEDAVDNINDNIYISPLLFLAQSENPFKQDQMERKLPINFTFPKSNKYMINIDVPEAYTIDYIPKAQAFKLPNDKGYYSFNIKESPTGDLQIVVKKELKESILSHDYYQVLKDFYKTIVNLETDKIVLVKQ
ncbi:DUF3857 domain-containing protein [Mesohalobacter halotolerans]|uniref:DUF3857 domain-containing protein n=1 Tax=Mesohalobacter halotolerans TaxID=1883405 RepID=A0A4U5TTI5_9FLAO|nr:DUF3857 domain-containing protein [Mesohalobacter halotolerans]TKS56794.1 DUF3857 domain-containing protein [Mesohalobacter halotolerans]